MRGKEGSRGTRRRKGDQGGEGGSGGRLEGESCQSGTNHSIKGNNILDTNFHTKHTQYKLIKYVGNKVAHE